MTDLLLYTPQKLRPPVVDIVKAIAEDYPEIGQVAEWRRGIAPHLPVLCFNAVPAETPLQYVKTMSQKQVLSKASAVTEIKAALDLLFRPRKLRDFSYEVWGLEKNFKQIDLGNVVVVDIETGGDIKTWKPEEMWLLCCALYDGKKLIVLTEEWLQQLPNRQNLINFLTRPQRKLIAHNMKFDFRSLNALLGMNIYGHMDTQLLHHAINPGAGEHGLKPLARKYLGAPDWDAESKKYVKGNYKLLPTDYYYPRDLYDKYVRKFGKVPVGYEAIPRDILHEYNAWDVYWTWHLMEYLVEISDERVRRVAIHEYKMGNLFQDIEGHGVALNWAQVDSLTDELNAQKAEVRKRLDELVAPEFNPNSPVQVKEVLASAGLTPKSTDEKTLNALHEDPRTHPRVREFIDSLLEYRGITKMQGTYVEGMRKREHEDRVYPTYKVHGTNTGRLSAADPNIQNIPREKALRNLFTVGNPETHSFLEVDYSQAELRVMAVLSGDDYLISLFQPGMPDFFTSLLPVTFPHHDISSWTPQERKDNRAKLKSVVYGLSYGRKAAAIATELKISTREAQTIIDNYFKAAPAFYEWRERIEYNALASDGVIETPFGRRFQGEIITGRTKANVINSALSFIPQSTASDICVSAAMEIHKKMPAYNAKIIASIHDAINSEVPNEYVEEVARMKQEEMSKAARRVFGDVVPFDTEAEWGTIWGDLHHTFEKE